MVASWVLIAVLSSLLSQTASASETDEGTGQSKLSVNISIHEQQRDDVVTLQGEWLDSVLGLTPRQLRSDKDKEMFWATRKDFEIFIRDFQVKIPLKMDSLV